MKKAANSLLVFAWVAALALAATILSRLPIEAILPTLAAVPAWQWAVWVGLNLLVITLLTGRWLLLTRALSLSLRFAQLLRIRQAGMVVSFVTPGPQFGGEPLQVYWLWQRHRVPGPSAFLALGLDRFFELWVNFSVLALAVLVLFTAATLPAVDWPALLVALSGLLSILLLAGCLLFVQPTWLRKLLRKILKRLTRPWRHHQRLARLKTHWSDMSGAMQRVFSDERPVLFRALALSLLAWGTMIAEFWLMLLMVGVPFDLATYLFLFTVMRLAFLLPLPGGIGSVEAVLFWGFQALALSLPAAAGLILLLRLRDVAVLLLSTLALPGLRHRTTATAVPATELNT